MVAEARVAVCSRSFSANPVLRAEILERYQQVTFNDRGERLSGDRLAEFLSGHEKVIVGLEVIDGNLLDRVPELEVVSKYGVGLDSIDLAALAGRGVRLGWTPGVNSRAVAELVLAVAISLLREVPRLSAEVRAGEWRQVTGGCLTGRTVGIVGWGSVGQDLASLLVPFHCEILVNDVRRVAGSTGSPMVEQVDLESLLRRSDVVTLHVPLTPETTGLLGAADLATMKDTAVLVNAARGGIVDEPALAEALRHGWLSGAALDVFETEPPIGSDLLALLNFLPTPHIGGSTHESYEAMGRAAIAGLDDNFIPEA